MRVTWTPAGRLVNEFVQNEPRWLKQLNARSMSPVTTRPHKQSMSGLPDSSRDSRPVAWSNRHSDRSVRTNSDGKPRVS